MKYLFVALVSVNCAILSVSANDKTISTYQLESFDQNVSTELVAPLVQTSDTGQTRRESLWNPDSETACEIEFKQANQIFQDINIPFTPRVREAILKESTLDAIQTKQATMDLDIKEQFRLLNLAYGYRHR